MFLGCTLCLLSFFLQYLLPNNFMRVVNLVEKNIKPEPAAAVTIAANTSTDILPDITTSKEEYSGRYIFNNTGAFLYYAFGQDCDNVAAYHGVLQNLQQLDCSNHGTRVSVYSAVGGVVVPCVLRRRDMTNNNNTYPSPVF